MIRFDSESNFNIASTIINDKIRVSTAAIYYDDWIGGRHQLETWVFIKDDHRASKVKIHSVPCNDNGLKYCNNFHNKVVGLINIRLNKNEQTDKSKT